jgi:hypothetical protein
MKRVLTLYSDKPWKAKSQSGLFVEPFKTINNIESNLQEWGPCGEDLSFWPADEESGVQQLIVPQQLTKLQKKIQRYFLSPVLPTNITMESKWNPFPWNEDTEGASEG